MNGKKNSETELPKVVIFGRTNVGKSSLFNTLIENKQALVSDIEGTTRDANRGQVAWQRQTFELIDTGGIINFDRWLTPSKKKADDLIQAEIEKKAKAHIKQANIILFVVDNRSGLLPQDLELSLLLKKMLSDDASKVMLVANKVDSFRHVPKSSDFYRLSLGNVWQVSAATGSGTGDLLDAITTKLKQDGQASESAVPDQENIEDEPENKQNEEIRVAMIGKPNVGKSSLLNTLAGTEQAIVSPIAHTTREPQDTVISYRGRTIRLVDTAGMSRQGSRQQKKDRSAQLEKLGIEKSLGSLEKADIALFLMSADEPLTHQDSKVLAEIIDRQKSLIIVANKWDLVEEKNTKKFTQYINRTFPFALWAPIIFISAKTGAKTKKVLDLIIEVAKERQTEIPPSVLNTFLMKIVKIHKPAKAKGEKHPHIHKFEQKRSNPPLFEVRIGSKDTLHFSYVRFIANRLREKFGFKGTPIRIWVSKNRKVHGQQNEGRGYVPLDMQSASAEEETPDETELNF
jgi:GTP-binding protein